MGSCCSSNSGSSSSRSNQADSRKGRRTHDARLKPDGGGAGVQIIHDSQPPNEQNSGGENKFRLSDEDDKDVIDVPDAVLQVHRHLQHTLKLSDVKALYDIFVPLAVKDREGRLVMKRDAFWTLVDDENPDADRSKHSESSHGGHLMLQKHLFELFDADHSHTLSFDQFVKIVSGVATMDAEDIADFVFDAFDADQCGFLSAQEWADGLAQLSKNPMVLRYFRAKQMGKRGFQPGRDDQDNDGMISPQEFREFVAKDENSLLIWPMVRLVRRVRQTTLGDEPWKHIQKLQQKTAREELKTRRRKRLQERVQREHVLKTRRMERVSTFRSHFSFDSRVLPGQVDAGDASSPPTAAAAAAATSPGGAGPDVGTVLPLTSGVGISDKLSVNECETPNVIVEYDGKQPQSQQEQFDRDLRPWRKPHGSRSPRFDISATNIQRVYRGHRVRRSRRKRHRKKATGSRRNSAELEGKNEHVRDNRRRSRRRSRRNSDAAASNIREHLRNNRPQDKPHSARRGSNQRIAVGSAGHEDERAAVERMMNLVRSASPPPPQFDDPEAAKDVRASLRSSMRRRSGGPMS